MSFVAGAIVGNVLLDTSGFTGGLVGMISAATAGGPSMAAPLIAAADLIAKTFESAFNFVVDTVKSVGKEFDDLGETAERAGVSTEFLSTVGRAAADSGSSVAGLADAMKFLNKNAAEAAAGDETAIKSFQALGISQQDVQANLGNTEALFGQVVEGMGTLGTTAEKTSASMGLLGRGGSELIPLINQGKAGIDEWSETIKALGANVTDEQAAAGDAFGKLSTVFGAAWDGIKAAVATPILTAIAGDGDKLKDTVIQIAGVIRDWIPPALNVIKAIVDFLLSGVDKLLFGLQGVARLSDAVGITHTAGDDVGKFRAGVSQVRDTISKIDVTVNASINPDDATTQIAQKIGPEIRQAGQRQTNEMAGAARRAVVASGIGGRAS